MVEKGWILKNDDNKIKWMKERKKRKKGNNEGEKKEENKKIEIKIEL